MGGLVLRLTRTLYFLQSLQIRQPGRGGSDPVAGGLFLGALQAGRARVRGRAAASLGGEDERTTFVQLQTLFPTRGHSPGTRRLPRRGKGANVYSSAAAFNCLPAPPFPLFCFLLPFSIPIPGILSALISRLGGVRVAVFSLAIVLRVHLPS